MRHFLLLLLLTLVTGCSSYQSPVLTVASVQVTDQSDDAVQLGFDLQLTNPNAVSLELIQFDYDLHVNGQHVFHGRRAAQATLNWSGERHLTIPAVVPFKKTGWTTAPETITYELTGSLLYVTPGEIAEILLDAGIRRPRVAFSGRGTVDLTAARSE